MGKKVFSILLCALLTAALFAPSVSANSAQTNWSGTSSAGTLIRGEDCPLTVQKEVLTLDAPEFPQSYYSSVEEFLAYPGSVTAEYTFYNPADYTVTATLAFPFGRAPDYSHRYDPEWARSEAWREGENYGVAVNGETIDAALRYTLAPFDAQFDVEVDLSRLLDEYREDEFYSPSLPVTEYTYTVTNAPGPEASLTFHSWFGGDGTKTRVYSPNLCGMSGDEENGVDVDVFPPYDTHTFRLYVMGEPLAEDPLWSPSWNAESSLSREPGYTLSTRSMTFEDFVMMDFPEDLSISKTDWYNAALEKFQSAGSFSVVNWFDAYTDLSSSLMRWYEYELTLEPGETLTNTVTAPLYPDINTGYEPPVYRYTYLLSPAKTWAGFGSLDILVNTPYEMTESSLKGFQKTGEGYSLSLPGLPEEELTFSLSADARPKRNMGSSTLSFAISLFGIAVYVVIGLAILLAVVLIVLLIISRKKRKKQR